MSGSGSFNKNKSVYIQEQESLNAKMIEIAQTAVALAYHVCDQTHKKANKSPQGASPKEHFVMESNVGNFDIKVRGHWIKASEIEVNIVIGHDIAEYAFDHECLIIKRQVNSIYELDISVNINGKRRVSLVQGIQNYLNDVTSPSPNQSLFKKTFQFQPGPTSFKLKVLRINGEYTRAGIQHVVQQINVTKELNAFTKLFSPKPDPKPRSR